MAEPTSCLRCGALGPEGAAFCVECGARIPPLPATGDVAATLPGKGSVRKTARIDVPAVKSPRSKRSASRPKLPASATAAGVSEGAATSMSEALKDVILDQIAREDVDSSAPGTMRIVPASEPAVTQRRPSDGAETARPEIGLEDIDSSFENLLSDVVHDDSLEPTTADVVEVQALFKQIAAEYLGPVRDFMVELGLGSPSKDWLAICAPAVHSLHKSAESMGLMDLARALDRLSTAFDEVERLPGPVIGDVARHVLDNAHQDLARLLPEAFAISEERDRREPIIVQTLLRQVPDLKKVALDRLYAAGVTRLEMFYVARPEDLAEATGVSLELCTRIVERFQRFRAESAEKPAGDSRAQELTRLGELVTQLGRQTLDYEKAMVGQRGLDKKRLRKQRAETVLEIQLSLARLGRVELVQELEKLPFSKKVETLVKFLGETKRAASSGG